MAEKIVTIEIDEKGESSIDLEGFQGKGCGDVAATFQERDSITRSVTKREFHVEVARTSVKRQQQGQ